MVWFWRRLHYEIIEFDSSQTQTYAEELVALGHPDWEGRMSGTIEEANTSQYIIDQLVSMGYEPQSNEYHAYAHVNLNQLRLCARRFWIITM